MDTSWVVDALLDGGSASSVPAGIPAVFILYAGTPTTFSFSVRTGCAGGELLGDATVAGDTITLRPGVTAHCSDGGNNLDDAVRSVLDGPVTYQLSGARLTLTAADGSGLGLRAGE